MKNFAFIITFLFYYFANSIKYLTKSQLTSIQKIIQNPYSTPNMIRQVNKVLFIYYNDWAWEKAYCFKKKHPHKCYHISLNELSVYASIGLIKSIQNYKGTSNFAYYANCYINGELYNAITELHPITTISKKDRKKKIDIEKKNQTKRSEFVLLQNNEWLFNKYLLDQYEKENEKYHDIFTYRELWNKIDSMSDNKILHYKFNYQFDKQMSNKKISDLFDMSEENVRQKIISISEKLQYL